MWHGVTYFKASIPAKGIWKKGHGVKQEEWEECEFQVIERRWRMFSQLQLENL